MSAQWNLFVDVARCTGCRNCFIAVKDEYVGNEAPGVFAPQPVNDATWFSVEHHERGRAPFTQVTYLPKTCRHCDDAPCVRAATGGAVEKRPDGIVVIHPEKAVGQTAIVEACPFGAVVWNAERRLPQAWPFDAHLLDAGWTRTRAEQACPTGALKSEKLTDTARAAKCRSEGWRVLSGEEAMRPRVFYRGLDRLERRLFAATVNGRIAGRAECVEGATVTLRLRDGSIRSATTDAFGDFLFELDATAEPRRLTIDAAGFRSTEVDGDVEQTFGTVFALEPLPA